MNAAFQSLKGNGYVGEMLSQRPLKFSREFEKLFKQEIVSWGMKEIKLKKYLNEIAERLTENSTLEDVYEQLSFLSDIDDSEEQVEKGETLTQKEVENKAKEWLK